MSARPSLHAYIDEEMLRAPMTIDLVIDAVVAQWRLRPPPYSRVEGDPVRVLLRQRGEVVGTALRELRELAQAELRQLGADPAAAPSRSAAAPREAELALIGEDDVAVDIEIARCIQTAKLTAEVELRTLQTYTSTLVDDPNVSRDTNPFRPERFVQALWAGVQALPLSRAAMAAFLHEAAEPLAAGLKRSYQAAWQRLADQGVTPATHRTIVTTSGGWGGTGARYRPPDGFGQPHAGLASALSLQTPPLPPPAPAAPAGAAAAWRDPGLARTSAATPGIVSSRSEPDLFDLLDRLFETIRRDLGLPPEAAALLQPLQPTAQRLARHDPSLLDSYEHPLWRFMDQMVHDIQTAAPAQRPRLAGLARNLVDHLSGFEAGTAAGFVWALERLHAAQRHALAVATTTAAPAIERLQRRVCADAPASTSAVPLDIASLDTVPAELITEPAAAQTAADLLGAGGLRPGSQLRAYLQGDWRLLVALWQDEGHELVLLHDPAAERLWALRQRALARLLDEGLAQPWRVRSLVRRAADRLLRGK